MKSLGKRLSKILSIGFVLAITAVSGCKASRFQKEKEPAGAAAAPQPKRLGAADATPASTVAFDVDAKTSHPHGTLVLRLDYFPAPKSGVTNLPVCYGAFGGDFEVGVAYCDGKPETQMPVTAKNLDQDCYTDSKQGRRAAMVPLTLLGCRKGVMLVHSFEPQLRVDLEIRDIN